MNQTRTKTFTHVATMLIAAMLLGACAPVIASASIDKSSHSSPAHSVEGKPPLPDVATKIDPLAFQQAVRKLWEDHITWTRDYIIVALAGLPEADAAAQRLLQNQVDIGDAIKPFYGDSAGDQLTSLLTDHILIAVELLAAAKSGDTTGFEVANTKWYENADQIASFLSSANPKNWSLDMTQAMMKTHLDLTLKEASARLAEDWSGDVAAYDEVHAEILEMADMLSAGIIRQFPARFAHKKVSSEVSGLTLAMDKLWEDHVTWTRMFIISATIGLPDAEAAASRLLQNQDDLGNAIKPIYGEAAGNQLTALLREHILTAVDLLAAAKAGDTAGFDTAKKLWYENAAQIAELLSSANPQNWPLDEMTAMMVAHLDLTLEEASSRLGADWAGDVAAYDKVHDEILEMSAMLTNGIIAQYPELFK